jgi:hypothetical protein
MSPWRKIATEELTLAVAGLEHLTAVTATEEPMPAAAVKGEEPRTGTGLPAAQDQAVVQTTK